jgi:cathepsin B
MKIAICLLLVVCVAFASHPVNKEIVEEIKKSTNLWWPVEPENNIFRFHNEEQITSMLGTKIDEARDRRVAAEMGIVGIDLESDNAAPAEFDSREAWDMCPFDIKDQGHCGSCWAFGAVESLEDRVCIKSQGGVTADLSEQNMVSCDWVGFGCSGGYPLSAFAYLSIMGVPTEECVPYTSGQSGEAWGCSYKCDDPSVSNKRYKCEYPWMSFTKSAIKSEIQKEGPVETGFTVYEDFMNYAGGIYHHTTGKALGGHAVKIVGWGVEEGVKYWLVANSWSTTWGEEGYFRIKEGNCGIATTAYSCTPHAY